MAGEVKYKAEMPLKEKEERQDTLSGLKSAIKAEKRKLIVFSELLKPKF